MKNEWNRYFAAYWLVKHCDGSLLAILYRDGGNDWMGMFRLSASTEDEEYAASTDMDDKLWFSVGMDASASEDEAIRKFREVIEVFITKQPGVTGVYEVPLHSSDAGVIMHGFSLHKLLSPPMNSSGGSA